MGSVSLLDGWVPVTLLVLGGVGLFLLLARWGRGALVTAVVAVLLAALTFLLLNPLVVHVLDLLPDPLPEQVLVWMALAVGAVVLLVGGLVRTGAGRKVVALVSGVLLIAACASQINVYFQQYPTIASLGGNPAAGQLPGGSGHPSVFQKTAVDVRWENGPTGPSRIDTAPIPGTVSGFTGRDAYIYLPPAYTGPTPPQLPVLVLVAGQPGGPADWVSAGQLQKVMDGVAARYQGLAPVTVVVDPDGSDGGNTMCMDSDIAKADTYLSVDVPNWITANLGIDSNHAHWAFGGWSYGGTCALQMATRHPDLYPNFIDMAGEREPAISADRTETIQQAFHGDTAAFDALVPLTLLAQKRYPNVWGYFSDGGDEVEVGQWTTEVSTAAQKAGMTVKTQVVPGLGHSWGEPQASLPVALQWLDQRLGLRR
ncbi:alpha/beta hydrolase-fold protein [Pseudonocardia ailaonensis]|uniref:Alpha/beta hydrolase-fold protein n=1 Tax=Pseudonocardia ailaonensis TaxID=367279 RepID=A0ABN2MQE5_9PSEU